MVTAKEYLSRLRNIDLAINAKQYEVDQLKILATCTGGFSNDDINVSRSKSGDTLERKVVKYVDLEREINENIDTLIDLRHTIIDEIYKLTDSKHIKLLFKRYVEYKHFEKISCEMNYSFDRIRHLHIEALEAFQEEILSHKSTLEHAIAHVSTGQEKKQNVEKSD